MIRHMLVFTLQERGLLCDFDDRDIETVLDVYITMQLHMYTHTRNKCTSTVVFDARKCECVNKV